MEVSEIGSSLARGATYIFAGRVLAYVFNFIGSLLLARLLALKYGSSEPLGWLLVLSFIPQFTLLLYDFGIGYGLLNRTSKLMKEKKIEEVSEYTYSYIFFTLPIWVFYSIFTLLIGEWLAINLYSKPEIIPYIPLMSLYILISYLGSIASYSALILDKTWIISLMLLIHAIIQAIAPISLILGFDLFSVILIMYVFAPLFSAIPGLIIFFKYFKLKRVNFEKIKDMIKFGFPLAASNYTAIPSARIYEILISRFATSAALGNYSVANRFFPFIEIFIYPISYLIFPNYSKLNSNSDMQIALNFTIKILAYFIAPISMFFIFFPQQVIITVFGPFYKDGWIYLSLLALGWLTYCFGGFAISTLIASQGYTKMIFKLTVISVIINLTLNVILIPLFSIIGAIITVLISGWPSYFLALRFLNKKMNVKVNFNTIFKIILVAFISILPSFLIWNIVGRLIILIDIAFYSTFIFCALFSLSIYIILTKRLEIFKLTEIEFIEQSLKNLPILGNFINIIFSFYRKI